MNKLSGLKFIYTLGVQEEHTSIEKRNIIFTNQAAFVLLLFSLCIATANCFFSFYLRMAVPLSTFCCLLSVFYFQSKHQYFIAKYLTVHLPFFAAILSTLIFGSLANTQYYILTTMVLGFIIFHRSKNHLAILTSHYLALLMISLWVKNNAPLIANQDSYYLGVINLAIISACIFITLNQFKVHYHIYEEEVSDLILAIQEKSTLLKKQNIQIAQQKLKLLHSNESLKKEIAAKETVRQKLLNSNEELQRFAYVASHDLKEPLRTIGSFTQILQKKLEPEADSEAKEYFRFVIQGVKRMSSLLDDLLSLSRLNQKVELKQINLSNMVELINVNLRNQISKSNGKIIAGKLPIISGNKTQITQLFQNLISNAFKFKKDIPSIVEINCTETENHFQFQIRDNGIGISPRYQQQIFIIFKKLHTRDKYEGTGIGLAVCKKIVKIHGGKIWIESEEGVGTTMFFTIKKDSTSPKIKDNLVVVEAQ